MSTPVIRYRQGSDWREEPLALVVSRPSTLRHSTRTSMYDKLPVVLAWYRRSRPWPWCDAPAKILVSDRVYLDRAYYPIEYFGQDPPAKTDPLYEALLYYRTDLDRLTAELPFAFIFRHVPAHVDPTGRAVAARINLYISCEFAREPPLVAAFDVHGLVDTAPITSPYDTLLARIVDTHLYSQYREDLHARERSRMAKSLGVSTRDLCRTVESIATAVRAAAARRRITGESRIDRLLALLEK